MDEGRWFGKVLINPGIGLALGACISGGSPTFPPCMYFEFMTGYLFCVS